MEQNQFSTEGVTQSDRIMHTPGDFAKNNLIYIQEVGKLVSIRPHQCIREHVNSYLLMMVRSGRGVIVQDGTLEELKAGDCAFLNGNGSYSHESSEEEPWELIWVHFTGAQSAAFYEQFFMMNKKASFRPKNADIFLDHLQKLLSLHDKKDTISELLRHTELTQALTEIITEAGERIDSEGKVNFNEVREKINTIYDKIHPEVELAEEYHVTVDYLQKEFLQRFGIGLSDYIMNRRFTTAKELLRFSVKPVEDIVEESGIRDSAIFDRMFLEQESMTATEYRRKWAQWLK